MPKHDGVAVVLVSHDGSSWLPGVLDGLLEQTRPADVVVAVDTGSRDDSAALVRTALEPRVPLLARALPRDTSYPDAVADALATLESAGREPEWIWLLHDDSRPAPGALAALLDAAARHPDADILGPKLREWPSLRRLLEVGVTISGTGRRETGLERGEYDQGQHSQVREVLAVNTAGMLVRRSALVALGGLDPALPVFGNDLDLGWRAAAAGRTTLAVPAAVVFHAEAAHRGLRRTPLTGRHTHFAERRAALFTLLANGRGPTLGLKVVRLVLGTVLRMLGLLCARAVGEALDEAAALVSVLRHPGRIRAARRSRSAAIAAQRGDAGPDRARTRRLLAPWWLPYRHGLDVLGDLLAAATHQAADVAERRRAAAIERGEAPPVARHRDEEDEFADNSLAVRFFTSPVALATALTVIALLVGVRDVLGGVSGGALSPAPDSAGDWWRLHLQAWHPLGFGSQVPAPPYVLPLALGGSVLGPTLLMSALMALSAPLALWGAWRFLRVVGRLATPYGAPRWLLLWGSVAWALVPLTSGAWGGGRWGVVVGAAVLPWLAHAALGFVDPAAERRWRAAWRTGLALSLLVAFVPPAWLLCLVLSVVLVGAAARVVPGLLRDRSLWLPPLAALAVPLVVLAPWWLPSVLEGGAAATLLDVGRWPTAATTGWDLLAGRFGDLGAPAWVGLVLPLLALGALVPPATRVPVVLCWLVAAVTALVAVPLALVSVELPGGTEQQPGLGAVLLVLHGAWLSAALLGALSLRDLAGRPRPMQALLLLGGVVALLAPLVGLVWFAGWGGDDLEQEQGSDVPVYMEQRAADAPENGVLVLRGSVADGLRYTVYRGDGLRVGEDEVAALTPEDEAATEAIAALVTSPDVDAVETLRELGIRYVVQPAPVDGSVATRLDATSGLEQASAPRGTRAWEVAPAPDAFDSEPGWWGWGRWLLLLVQAGAVCVLVVLSLPPLRRSRDD
ncbi:glycosyltransferase family 2 protein [Nocardioides sp. zg-536]|uniref:Glycosyltransferase family 2 protein n=1 Tax=Nocardioides faecalis TaxID=2803858 RepID=A0A938Y6W0_9ACTN|nr:glycosyltransferase family 2 protein [Nocardioides faecalis]MBM9459323.1 glycosyltransferase family 2 protein [Nocardioides faecalis]MBS4751562.1 glycosyltransferase family 2 protein [Nocardioides faecalis]QVI59556.1 glycosyltransferase family 2 protein [Nocardioides faecalis]